MKQVFQFTGLSGVGKSTLAQEVKERLTVEGYGVEVLDGDELRKTLSVDLGFSERDRLEHLRRVAQLAIEVKADVVLIAVINPYEQGRLVFKDKCKAELIWLKCELEILKERDTKGLYHRAFLPQNHPDKLNNLTGVNAPFEKPTNVNLIVNTDNQTIGEAATRIFYYIINKRTKSLFAENSNTFSK